MADSIKMLQTQLKLVQQINEELSKAESTFNKFGSAVDKNKEIVEKALKVQDKLVKGQKEQTKVTKEVAEETDELADRIERINKVNTEFSKRTKILSEAIARQAITNSKGFNLGIESFRAYQKAGGNAFEYLAEFISSAREEVQIFGMEAAKLRKVMYGFLPSGTFRVLNKFSSVLQFTGGMLRNLRDDAEDIEGPFKKLSSAFLKFGKLRNPLNATVRNIFPKEMPKLVKHRKELLEVEKKLSELSDEDKKGKVGAKLRGRKRTLERQIPLMEKSDTQKMFNQINKTAGRFAQAVGVRTGRGGKAFEAKERNKELLANYEELLIERNEAERIGDEVLLKRLENKMKKIGKEMEDNKETISKFNITTLRKDKESLEGRTLELKKKKKKEGLTEEEGAELKANNERLKEIKEELGDFRGLGKAIGLFTKYSMSRKAKQIQEGAGRFFKNIVPTLKMVLLGFLQAFIYISLIIVAIYFIKKFFENNQGVMDNVISFLESTYNFFMENIYPLLEDGIDKIKKAFSKDGDLIMLLEGLLLVGAGILATAVVALGAAVIAILYTLYEAARKYLTDKFNEAGSNLGGIWKIVKILVGVAAAIALLVTFGWVPLLAAAMGAAVIKAFRKRRKEEKGQAMAKGGLVTSNLQLVGEEGPELVSIPQGSRVRTASQTRAALANNNQTVNNFNITINAKDTSRAEMRRIADEIGKMVNSKINRSVSSRTLG